MRAASDRSRVSLPSPFHSLMRAKSLRLYAKAKKLIPGAVQLFSKRPELYLPDQWPAYYSRAKGVQVCDMDGNRYTDMASSGIGACILGVGDPDVDRAVRSAIAHGTASTLNCPEEVELAELLIELHPWADMVRYARCGGEAMAIAARIVRARTRKDCIAFCGYHGWHDWYLAANLAEDEALDGHLLKGLAPLGVPRGLTGTVLPFHYNRIAELEAIVERKGKELAAIIMEPIRNTQPEDHFLQKVRAIATRLKIPLVFDEVSAGFRLATGGAHLTFGVEPDIAVFAKGMSNGYPMAAIIGRGNVMEVAQDTFISSTYWTERIGPAAAIATIRKHRKHKVHEHLIRLGTAAQEGWRACAEAAALSIDVSGIPPLAHFSIQHDDAQAAHTLFIQEMLHRGYLADSAFYPTFAHTEAHVRTYLRHVGEVFRLIANALRDGKVNALLKGPVAHSGFQRLT